MNEPTLDDLYLGETIYKADLDNMLTAGPKQAKLAERYKDMGLKKTHISWGSRGQEHVRTKDTYEHTS